MVITLTGANHFSLSEELRRLTRAFAAEHDATSIERLDGEEVDAARLREAATSLPFLTPCKMVVLREPGKQKAFAEHLDTILPDVAETTDLIIVEPKLDKRLSYYKTLKKQTDFREFPELDAPGLARWAGQYAVAHGGSLRPGDASLLIDRLGLNQQLLQHELDKLLQYDPQITRQSIELLTDATPQSTVFELLDAAFSGNQKRTMQLYAEQRALKVEPQAIIGMLAWQLHVLALVKTAGPRSVDDIARDAKLNPFVVRKSQNLTRRLTLDQLKQHIQRLFDLDLKLKTTALDADDALQLYLLQIA